MTGGSWNELVRWIRPMHLLWNQALDDMTADQVNHHERAGVLPVAFSLYHYVYGEDRAVAERILGEPTLWNDDWAKRTGIAIEPVRRGAPIEVAEQVRIADLGGLTLGRADGGIIWLDDNAAGWGWFVDGTPWEDSEFTTPGDQGEQGRMDLLTLLGWWTDADVDEVLDRAARAAAAARETGR